MSAGPAQVWFIGDGAAVPAGATPETVGAKAFNLMRMDALGLPVPPAFVLGTDLCRECLAHGGKAPAGFKELLEANVRRLENATGRSFGGRRRPLLVSVRSGAPVSMPGMLDTVLDVGLNDAALHGLLRATGNPRLAWDTRRRLAESFGTVVRGHPASAYEALAARHLDPRLCPTVRTLDALALRELAGETLALAARLPGGGLPEDPMRQLAAAVLAVFRSWNSPRAVEYRRHGGLDEESGTAVTVQAMVFGNGGARSGSGVGFTRDPSTGEDRLYVDFLFNAQGEDVVAGRHALTDGDRLAVLLPEVHERLLGVRSRLEAEFRDMQDFEFTVEDDELWLLQTRSAKRTPWAALQVAVDLERQGLVTPAEALARLQELDVNAIERARLQAAPGGAAIAEATSAGMGVAVGEIALDAERAVAVAGCGRPVVLVREDVATDDFGGLAAAEGILTARGGRTSHAAVVARQLGKACLVGCHALQVDLSRRRCRIAGREFGEGETLSLDGEQGRVFAGPVEVVRERPDAALAAVARWREQAQAGRAP